MLKEVYKNCKQACAEIKKQDARLLAEFEHWLSQKGPASRAIERHCQDVEPYVNTFLLYREAAEATPIARQIATFLGYWFIRKTWWANATAMKETEASLKKFFAFMQEKGQIDGLALKDLKQAFKEAMDDWHEEVGG